MGSRASEVPSRERWLVQHGFNATQVMTRRDLESAYRRGDIGARALVCRDGTARWQTLAELMDLDPDTTLESISLMPVASDVALPDVPELPLPKPAPAPIELPTEIYAESPRKRALKTLSLGVALAAFAGVFAGASTLFSGAPTTADPVSAALPPAEPTELAPKAPAALGPVLEEGSILVLARASTLDPAETPAAAPAKKPLAKKAPAKKR